MNAHSRNVDVARRTLAKLGAQMSLKPAPHVPVEERAGRTARVDMTHARAAAGTYAAIDLGSSSAKMLVVSVDERGRQRVLVDQKIGAGLGKDVATGGEIPKANRERALDALRKFLEVAREHGVDAADIPMITTAVVRNAPNGAAFLDEVHALGLVRAKTLSGDEEAAMGFAGALTMLADPAKNGALPEGRYATLDLGGGSFQLAIGTERGLDEGGSTQVGSNVILDMMLAPHAAADGTGSATHFVDVDAQLAQIALMPLDVAKLSGRTLVATGGVSKFLRAHFGVDVIKREDIEQLRRDVIEMPYAARVALVQRGKDDATRKALGVDTDEGALDYGKKLPASSSLLLHILRALDVDEVRVSETDARHALISTALAESSRG